MQASISMALFLALQGMITVAAAEVTIRYFKWWAATRNDGTVILRALLLGIAISHMAMTMRFSIFIYERMTNFAVMNAYSDGISAPSFAMGIVANTVLYVGIVGHLIPIWRIVHKYDWWEVAIAFSMRSGIAAIAYFSALHSLGFLTCYVTDGCIHP